MTRSMPEFLPAYIAAAVVILLVSSLPVSPSHAAQPEAKVRVFEMPEPVQGPSRTGFIPPPGDFSHLKPRARRTLAPLPERFDWRDEGAVTGVGDQGTCGCCWAFAGAANFESAILAKGGPAYNFSVNNIKSCDWWVQNTPWAGCAGGNHGMVVNFYSQKGAVLESCDPFRSSATVCVDTCPCLMTVTGWMQISGLYVGSTEAIKEYIYTYGPVFSAITVLSPSAWKSEFSQYDGTYTLYHISAPHPAEVQDHAVLIVGWDDNIMHAGGYGAWIAKNSWGTDWGDEGFFTIAYGSAKIGSYVSTIYDWEPYDDNGVILYHDEEGFQGTALGYSSTTAWGFCKYVPEEPIRIERVEFWSTDAASDVDVYIYDNFSGGTLSAKLTEDLDNSAGEYGYHSIELSNPIDVSAMNDIYVVLKITNESYQYPIAMAWNPPYAPIADGYCYVSPNGSSWQKITSVGCERCADSDLCIRVRGTRAAMGGTLRVPGKYATIAAALTAADHGDTVLVGPGTYNEGSLAVNKNILLMSEAGPESTVIDAGGLLGGPSSHAAVLSLSNVTGACEVDGFTLTGALSASTGGGIVIVNSAAGISNCIVAGNSAAYGAGILVQGSSPIISGCTVVDNTVLGGIYFDAVSGGRAERCIVTSTSPGAGVYCESAAPVISCCNIYSNAGGLLVGGTNGGDIFAVDPLYCDGTGGDYSLQEGSPCIFREGCGQIGALGLGCSTQLPSPLTAFSVRPGDTSIMLRWTLPEEPIQGAYIVYKTTGFPTGWWDGTPVPSDDPGFFPGSASAPDSFNHTGLVNGTTYYYAAYGYNLDYMSETALTAYTMAGDMSAPGPVIDFTAESHDGEITLFWKFPYDQDLAGVAVRYSTTSYPADPDSGSAVENGSEGEFVGESGSDTSFTHTGLTDGTTYYYSAFSYDAPRNYSEAASLAAIPGDGDPPSAVTGFTLNTLEGALRLAWANPEDVDFKATLIRYSTTSFPRSPTEGSPVENGASGVFLNTPASQDTFLHEGLENDSIYYYSAFAFDPGYNYAPAANVSGAPRDMTPPELAISVFRNPYIASRLDILVLASEPLLLDSLIVTVSLQEGALAVDEDTVDMEIADAEEQVYRGDYDLYLSGPITVYARATDMHLNPAEAERQFSSSYVLASAGGTIESIDGVLTVDIPPGTARRDGYILIWERSPEGEDVLASYEVSSASSELADYGRVEFTYGGAPEDARNLAVCSGAGSAARRLDSYIDTAGGRVIAYTRNLGLLSLVRTGDTPGRPLEKSGIEILYNTPNPFVHKTEIVYQIARHTDLTIDVVGIDGRVVKELHRGSIAAGRHTIVWDGTDACGLRVASGVYFIRITSTAGMASRKVAVLR